MIVILKNNNFYATPDSIKPLKKIPNTKHTVLRAIEIGRERCLKTLLNSEYILQNRPEIAISILSLSPKVEVDPEIHVQEGSIQYWLRIGYLDKTCTWLQLNVIVGSENIVDSSLKVSIMSREGHLVLYNSLK